MKWVYSLFLLFAFLIIFPSQIQANYTYTSPGNFTQTPPNPEIRAGESALIRKDPFVLILEKGTTPWDAYVAYGSVSKTQPIRLCRYWQISPIYEFKLRSHFNNAVIEPQHETLISFSYDQELLKVFPFVYFPENSLKIIESDDNGITWIMLKNSVVDTENNTVSAITDLNKGYAIVAGFVNPKILCNYDENVLGVTTAEISAQPIESIVDRIQFYYQVILDMLQYRSEKAVL